MSGRNAGLCTLVMKESPTAFYTHCCGHRINLVVQSIGVHVTGYQNAHGCLQTVCNIITESNNRLEMFEKLQQQQIDACSDKPAWRVLRLQRLSDTRWNCHIRAAAAVLNTFPCIISLLEHVGAPDQSTKPEKRCEATGALRSIKCFDFIFWLHVIIQILTETNELSESVQQQQDSMWEAIKHVQSCLDQLKAWRSMIGFRSLWDKSVAFCSLHGITDVPSNHGWELQTNRESRRTSRPPQRLKDCFAHSNTGRITTKHQESTSVRTSHKTHLFEILDGMIGDITERFSERNCKIIQATKSLSSFDCFRSFQSSDLKCLFNVHKEDFNCHAW